MPRNPLSNLRSILVPVSGSEAGYHALAAACDLARRARAQVYLLHVIEVPRSLSLDAEMSMEVQRGEGVLERAEAIAQEFGLRAQGDLVQARQAAHAIVDEVIERDADALVIGVDYDRPYGRFALGALPEYLLEHAPVEVWLIRYPSGETASDETTSGRAGGRRR